MKKLPLLATLLTLVATSGSGAAEDSPNDVCRQRDSPSCREFQEPRCQRDVEAWREKSAAARERIERNRRDGVSECQTIYELNGGRDPCKYSFTDACRAEQQRRCHMAVEGFMNQITTLDQTVPKEGPGRGDKVAEFRRRVDENRKRGVAECETWSDLSRLAAGQ